VDIALLLLMIGLLGLSAYFSGTEAALFSLSRLQVHQLEERRDRVSRRLLDLLRRPEETLATLLVGNNIINIALSSIATAFFLRLLAGDRGRAVELASLAVTLSVLFFGEITPKTLAVNFSLGVARLVASSFTAVGAILRPLTRTFHRLAAYVLRLLGFALEPAAAGTLISRAELHLVLEDADEERSIISPSESRLVQSILDLPTRTAEEIMTPRVDVVDLAIEAAANEAVQLMRTSQHSRYPVYAGEPDNVIGFVQAKEFLLNPERGLRDVLRPVAFFPESATAERIFYELQRSRTGVVIVVNEFGETVGLITREDVIEEIVGDIYDEFDRDETPIRKKGEGLYIVPGRIALQDLAEHVQIAFPEDSAVTLNGFVCEVYGRIPRAGTVVTWRDVRFHVLEVARHRVQKVLIEVPVGEGR